MCELNECTMSCFFPTQGFLGTGATFKADLNLIVQLLMGVALIVGVGLARQKRYKAHGFCQTTVLILNLVMIGLVMWPSFHRQVTPAPSKAVHIPYYRAAMTHGLLGILAELLGLYIVVSAGTSVLPQSLRLKRWRCWMRVELALWGIVLIGGLATYRAWYMTPFR